eukprot:Colp12_sorted_trinity150504_noHs@26772
MVFIVGIAGGTASGKTTVCEVIMEQLGQNNVADEKRQVVILHQDSFYKNLTEEQKANIRAYNFDHPDAFDFELLIKTLRDLKAGKAVEVPLYDFKTSSRLPQSRRLFPPDVILLEGILVLYIPELRDLMDMKLFVDQDSDVRLARRVVRDMNERGRDLESVLRQYVTSVKPAFDQYIMPTKEY